MVAGEVASINQQARVTLLSQEDIPRVVELFDTVWPGVADFAEHAAWAFPPNLLDAVPLVGAVDAAGRVMGARGGMPWPLTPGGTGTELRAVQLTGTCVHPASRRQGLFSRMTRDFVDQVRERGFDLIFNVSVSASRAGYEKLGWRYLPGLRSYHYLPRRVRPAWRLLRRRVGGARPASTPPAELRTGRPPYAALRELIEARERRLAGRYHSRYAEEVYDWRFSLRRHRFIGTPELGYCAYVRRERAGLADVLVGEVWPAPGRLRRLMRLVVAAEDPDLLTLWMTRAHPLRAAFLRMGFLPNPAREFNLGVRPLTARGEQALDPARWALMAADIDTF